MNNKQKTIAFGVAGEGRGHASRAIALSEALISKYNIVIFAPSTIRNFLSEHLPPEIKIVDIPGIIFHKKNHIIRYRKTILNNLAKINSFIPEVKMISAKLIELGVNSLISDFEPYTAIAADSLNIPVFNLNHPGIVLRYFSLKPDALAAKTAAKIMMPSGTIDFICSFYGGDVGPIIRQEIKNKTPGRKNYYLVYTKNESKELILNVIKNFPGIDFRVFPNKEEDFTEALINCKGVISSAGHQMISEALFLKKPVLAFPQKMQFEQRLNAMMLERSGWGIHGDIKRIHASISNFISSIDSFPYRCSNHDNFLFEDFTHAAANCISNFTETNVPTKIKTPFNKQIYYKLKLSS